MAKFKSLLDESGSEMQTEKKKTLKKSKLMHLLKLLKVLAYLENAKQKKVLSQKTVPASIDNSVVSEIEKLKFGEVENPQMIDNRFKNLHPSIHKASNSDLDALIKLVEMEKATEAPSQKMSKSNLKMVCIYIWFIDIPPASHQITFVELRIFVLIVPLST